MGQSQSNNTAEAEVELTPKDIVEQNNTDLLIFLFSLMTALLVCALLSIVVIYAFFPNITNSAACSSFGN